MHTPRTRATEKGDAMKSPKPKPFISVDFDGVLNNYSGYDGDNLGTPRPGAKEFLQELSKDYIVLIHTARRYTLVVKWLADNNLWDYVGDVSSIKQPSIAYIDDRGIQFNGDYKETLEQLKKFKPYWR